MDEQAKLALDVGDQDLIRYFYLNMTTPAVLEYMDKLRLTLSGKQDDVPFNAQVKSYFGARDQDGDQWIVKPVVDAQEMLYHRACELAYLLDHRTGTFAAPTTALLIDKKRYRATKVVPHAVQISSYNYMEAPFINILRADLVNRWIYFDEDRNPNNYLIINNQKNRQFIVAIDYDKADMLSETMKITGMPDKFGWLRAEKTRFLTLLRPDNFQNISIDEFEARLGAFSAVSKEEFTNLCRMVFTGYCDDPAALGEKTARNILQRRDYVNNYFRQMFKSADETQANSQDCDYSAFGESFMAMHNKKK
ncbi:MAG: hypothetical protein A2087_12320 [Spirochaetes bacterium GWD1_61_31]|nr:MAG: hypothetical protein A2Y37_07265 [Spirochaetes bacterium GWB1_60_80]OHD34018.1 MAG: hypothetical protein A2004_02195 [Spirochaetes bacterium GWC1_61_12]OHD35193.1 MAG: hypothetical protein A2087_12320 [Spirochaetes bacterium GWD1_61_31]OHD41398.1 MAG: hypothetical protein A2Y35_05510 [Spirochaetes bacterium GWE1_60_18]OHD59195.1 MAG: hypothetical protein A2Y32_00225 [Spirochaetes bacterium GWF1_60_12]HAP43104.1 hypothetical protein [Spirochaetaceae bacterium]